MAKDGRDRFEKFYDWLEAKFEKVIEQKIDEFWFTWLQWVIITGILYGIYRKHPSIYLIPAILFSFLIIWFKATLYVEGLIKTRLEALVEKTGLLSFFIVFLLAGGATAYMILLMAEVFGSFFEK